MRNEHDVKKNSLTKNCNFCVTKQSNDESNVSNFCEEDVSHISIREATTHLTVERNVCQRNQENIIGVCIGRDISDDENAFDYHNGEINKKKFRIKKKSGKKKKPKRQSLLSLQKRKKMIEVYNKCKNTIRVANGKRNSFMNESMNSALIHVQRKLDELDRNESEIDTNSHEMLEETEGDEIDNIDERLIHDVLKKVRVNTSIERHAAKALSDLLNDFVGLTTLQLTSLCSQKHLKECGEKDLRFCINHFWGINTSSDSFDGVGRNISFSLAPMSETWKKKDSPLAIAAVKNNSENDFHEEAGISKKNTKIENSEDVCSGENASSDLHVITSSTFSRHVQNQNAHQRRAMMNHIMSEKLNSEKRAESSPKAFGCKNPYRKVPYGDGGCVRINSDTFPCSDFVRNKCSSYLRDDKSYGMSKGKNKFNDDDYSNAFFCGKFSTEDERDTLYMGEKDNVVIHGDERTRRRQQNASTICNKHSSDFFDKNLYLDENDGMKNNEDNHLSIVGSDRSRYLGENDYGYCNSVDTDSYEHLNLDADDCLKRQ